jgi:tetratricopeptide (TPR) repeat protein
MNLPKFFENLSKEEKYNQAMNKGRTFLGNQKLNLAISEFLKAASYSLADLFEVHYRLGQAYYFQKQYSNAVDHLKVATENNPIHGDALYLYGLTLFTQLNFEKAKEVFQTPTKKKIEFQRYQEKDFQKNVVIIERILKSTQK